MESTTEQHGCRVNSSGRTSDQHVPGRHSTQGSNQRSIENQNFKSTGATNSSHNGDLNFIASQPREKPKQTPLTQNASYFSNDATASNSSCMQSSVSGWAVRPKLRKSVTSAAYSGPRTEELPKSSTIKSKIQEKSPEVDLPQAFIQQKQQTPVVNTVNAWAARNQTKKLEQSSLSAVEQRALLDEQMQMQQDALLAIKLQEEEEKMAAAWQRGGRKKQIVNQSSEAFPALLPPPSVVQGENTSTSKSQVDVVAQKPVSAFNSPGSQQVRSLSLADVAKLPGNSSSPSQSKSPVENATKKKTPTTNQSSEAFPALSPPPSAIQGKNTTTFKPQEDSVAQKLMSAFNSSRSQQVGSRSLADVAKLPKGRPSLIQSKIPVENTAKKTLNATPVTQSSEAFPALSPSSAVQRGNTWTSKPQVDAVAQKPMSSNFSRSQQVESFTPANVAKIPVGSASLNQSKIPFENVTEKKTLTPINENVELSHDDFEEIFQSDEDLGSDIEGADQTQNGNAEKVLNLEKADTSTSMIFSNRNLSHQQQCTESVTPAAPICIPQQAQSQVHNASSNEDLTNPFKMSQHSIQESVLKTTIGPAPTPVPETVVMQQVAVRPMPSSPTDVLYLAEHIASVKSKTDHAYRVVNMASELWVKVQATGLQIEESYGNLLNVSPMGMPTLQQNMMLALTALKSSIASGVTVAKAFLERYEEPQVTPNPTQNNMEPIIKSLPGGGTAVMMRPTSAAPTTQQFHPVAVNAFSLGMTAVNLYRKIREEWAGNHPVSSVSESNLLRCKEKIEALQRQQHPQQLQNLITEVCCDALFICNLAQDVVAHSCQQLKQNASAP